MHDPNTPHPAAAAVAVEGVLFALANATAYLLGNINAILQTGFLVVSIYYGVLGIMQRRQQLKLHPWRLWLRREEDDKP